MRLILFGTAFLALSTTAAMFGFFYAWVCSTMWGLDAIDPVVAIQAMQAMNASVRNGVFALGFFGTVPALLLATFAAWRFKRGLSAALFAASAVIYLLGVVVLTTQYNVSMNEELAALDALTLGDGAAQIWATYSADWQFWNITRTIVAWVVLMGAGAATVLLRAQGDKA